MTESEFIRHDPCPDCGSSDALAVYTDGHTFCFSCHTRKAGDGQLHTHHMQSNVSFKGSAQRLQKRGISEKTCEKYKIYRDETHLRFPYFDGTGCLKGFKTKDKLKNFKYEGVSTDTLFGQHLFPSTGKRIVITEGELDAASCYEAMENWPMVSLPHGAAGAKKDLQKQIPLLQGYQEIVLFFETMTQEEKPQKAASILPLVRSRLQGSKNTKMHQMLSKRTIKTLLEELSGMRNLINRMASLMGSRY